MINPFPQIRKGVLFYISAHNNNGMTLLYILLTVYILEKKRKKATEN